MRLILGSGSKGRQEVLRDAGYDFEIQTADIDEKAIRLDDPGELVLAIAHAKADAILPRLSGGGLLITGDQVVVCGGKILEKPRDEDEARAFIRGYRDNPMETVSGLVVTNISTGIRVDGVYIAKVYFEDISEEDIDFAIADGRVMQCAGAMRCEAKPFKSKISRFEGTEDSTSGMPLELLEKLLSQLN